MVRLPEEFFGFDDDFFDLFDRMMPSMRRRRLRNRDSNSDVNEFSRPRVDFYEEDGSFIAKIDMPGVNKEDIELNVNEREIEVKVEKDDEAEYKDEKRGYHRIERKSFGFYRNIPLPEEIDTEKTTARYDKGVLEIRAPKINGDNSKKKIDIK